MRKPVVRWTNRDTGEIQERSFTGVDRDCIIHTDGHHREFLSDWEATPLELALALVPGLETVIEQAQVKGGSVDITVEIREPV